MDCSLYQSSYNVALITEVAPVAIVPNFVLQKKLLSPFREQTGGTVLVSLSVCLLVSPFIVITCVHLCMCVYVDARVYVHVCVMYVRMCMYMCVLCMCVCVCTCVCYVCAYVYVHVCVMYVRMCMYMYVCMCVNDNDNVL